jgi:hypothetical protein
VAGAGAPAPSDPPDDPFSDEPELDDPVSDGLELDDPVSDGPALDDPDAPRPDPPLRPSFVAQPEPLNTIVGVETSFRIEPPHTAHVEGPWLWTPWRTSTVWSHIEQPYS